LLRNAFGLQFCLFTIKANNQLMMMKFVSHIFVASLLAAFTCDAWVPSSPRRSVLSTRLKETEKELREQLSDLNTNDQDEVKYAVPDGAYLEKLNTASTYLENLNTPNGAMESTAETTAAAASTSKPSSDGKKPPLTATMERLTKPRAYPLFLLEKAAELVESTVEGVVSALTGPTSANSVGPKERIVVLGTGWGSVSFLKDIDTDLYDVTVISPRNHFVFTPMLAGASVGTVEFRSICQPIREINRKANYLEATATDIDPKTKVLQCQSVVCDGNSCDIEDFAVEYDRLVVAVGAQTNTFGIPGVREHCCFLRQVEDARRIRTAIVNCFERASLPHLTDQQRQNDLTFAVIGAGPTGIEFAAELRDFVQEDGPKYYPKLLRHVRIKVIEASSTVLAPFDKSLQAEAIRQMNTGVKVKDPEIQKLLPERFKLTELLLDSSVKEVGEDQITLNDGTEIPYGLALWAAGNGPIKLTLQLVDALGSEQKTEQDVARGRLAIDPWMRVIGSEGEILSFGDCSCIAMGQLPATAQVAGQQGEYLAALMNRKFDLSPVRSEEGIFPPPKRDPARTETSVSDAIASFAINSNEYSKPFQFLNLGILAYTGQGTALSQVTLAPDGAPVLGSGWLGNAVWRSVYLSKQVSWRNRLLVLNDWTNRQIFGRDVTRI
jgi:NADH dehydrogenase FAD-containing subunit